MNIHMHVFTKCVFGGWSGEKYTESVEEIVKRSGYDHFTAKKDPDITLVLVGPEYQEADVVYSFKNESGRWTLIQLKKNITAPNLKTGSSGCSGQRKVFPDTFVAGISQRDHLFVSPTKVLRMIISIFLLQKIGITAKKQLS